MNRPLYGIVGDPERYLEEKNIILLLDCIVMLHDDDSMNSDKGLRNSNHKCHYFIQNVGFVSIRSNLIFKKNYQTNCIVGYGQRMHRSTSKLSNMKSTLDEIRLNKCINSYHYWTQRGF